MDDIQNSDDSTHASPLVQISATDDKQICLGPCKTKAPAVSTGKPAFVQSTTSVFVTKVVKAKTASFHKRQSPSTHLQTEAANCIFDHPAYVTRIRRHLSRSKQPLWEPALVCLYVCVCVFVCVCVCVFVCVCLKLGGFSDWGTRLGEVWA